MASNVRTYDFVSGVETDDLPVAGTPSAEDDNVTLGFLLDVIGTRAAPIAIAVGGILNVEDKFKTVYFIQGDGGPIDVTANPQIVAGTRVGQVLEIICRSDVNTVKLEDGTGLSLNGSFTMGEESRLELYWDGTNWIELTRSE